MTETRYSQQHSLCEAGDKAQVPAPANASSGQDLQGARLLAAPYLAAGTRAPTPAAASKGTKGAAKPDAMGAIPVTALAQLQQAAETCDAAMLKLSPLSNVAGCSC